MNKLFHGAAVLALAIGVSGPALAQDSGLATGQTDGVTSGRASMGTQVAGRGPECHRRHDRAADEGNSGAGHDS